MKVDSSLRVPVAWLVTIGVFISTATWLVSHKVDLIIFRLDRIEQRMKLPPIESANEKPQDAVNHPGANLIVEKEPY